MSDIDKILDPERWNDDSYGDLVTQVSSPTGANTLDAARLELAQLRRAKDMLGRIFEQECALLEVGSKPRLSSAEIRDARAILAEIDGKVQR